MIPLIILFKGLLFGFSIAAPVGPIGLLCINRTMQKGKLSGFLSGIGAASADMIYGVMAVFGLTLVSNMLIKKADIIEIVGGIFMCYLGVKIFISKPADKTIESDSNNLFSDYLSTFFLTITNPMTIISFTAVFSSLGVISSKSSNLSSVLLVLGVFFGSAFWWLILSLGVGLINRKSNNQFMPMVNKLSGAIICCFGLFALIK